MSTQTATPAAHPGLPSGPAITLSNDGSQWAGTFGIVVRALVTDILDDGEGFTATINTHQGDERTGTVQALDEGDYVVMGIADGAYFSVPIEDIVRIDVH